MEIVRVQVESDVNKIINAKDEAVEQAFIAIKDFMEEAADKEVESLVYAKAPSPNYKRTGTLRAEITAESDATSARVGSPTEYGIYVEMGKKNREKAPRPFIRNAVMKYLPQYKEILHRYLSDEE